MAILAHTSNLGTHWANSAESQRGRLASGVRRRAREGRREAVAVVVAVAAAVAGTFMAGSVVPAPVFVMGVVCSPGLH